MFEPTYILRLIFTIFTEKKKIIKYFTTKQNIVQSFFFSPIFFQLIFLRPLSRLRNFLISFTIHKIRSLLASLTHSLTTQTQKKTKKMLKMPPNSTITTTTRKFTLLTNFFQHFQLK